LELSENLKWLVVEILLRQVNIKEKINLTFPLVLRAILRQDPDVILLGEIRDLETAEVAFHAALTGHVVFSTLHTNSAVATVARLFDLGLKPYVVASALEGIIAQRLVRKICDQCREPGAPDPAVLEQLGALFEGLSAPLFRGKGCPKCNNSGYRGRVGLYEVLAPDEHMCNLISSGASILEINHYIAVSGAYRTMLHDAFDKVAAGLTTCEEILRVLGPQDSPCPPPAAHPSA
jgi:type II secretory ATPase GspE/PulE/Tfp pilus assembly ATPase PilB-like protein